MDHDLRSGKMRRPVCPRTNVANRPDFDARYWVRRAARYAENIVAARAKATAQRIADEARCTGHQNARQARSSNPQSAAEYRKRSRLKRIIEGPVLTQGRPSPCPSPILYFRRRRRRTPAGDRSFSFW